MMIKNQLALLKILEKDKRENSKKKHAEINKSFSLKRSRREKEFKILLFLIFQIV